MSGIGSPTLNYFEKEGMDQGTSYFQNPSTNPFGISSVDRRDSYHSVFQNFQLGATAHSTQSFLLEYVIDMFKGQAVGGLGIFVTGPQLVYRLRVIHGICKFPGPLGKKQEHSKTLAKCLVRASQGHLGCQLAKEYAPAPGDMETHTETAIKSQKTFFIPYNMVLWVIGKRFTPRKAFILFQPHLETNSLMEICKPILHTTSVRDPCHHRALDQSAMAAALTDHQLRIGKDQERRHLEYTKVTSVEDTWDPLYTKRLRILCGKSTNEDLPPIYLAWTRKKKNEKTRMIFQSQVNVLTEELNIFAPLATTSVLKQFQDCNFHGTDPFGIVDDILPFAFIPPGGSLEALKRRHEEAATVVVAYITMISTEGNSLTPKNFLTLHKMKAYIP
eukprot:jgi/Psemu1/14310/gm1.14310_g